MLVITAVQGMGGRKKLKYHDTEIGTSYYKAPCSQTPPKKEKPAPEQLRTKEGCCDTREKAFGLVSQVDCIRMTISLLFQLKGLHL